MSRSFWIGLLIVSVGAAALVLVAGRLLYFVAPFAWTREPDRLGALLHLTRGAHVADIGAGDGALAAALAPQVGPTGRVFVTEISPVRLEELARRARADDLGRVTVVTATAETTGLPHACCDGIYLRTVFHHIGDGPAFARGVSDALKAGGRAVVIDFPPGGLPFHGADHGVTRAAATAAFQAAGLVLERTLDDWGGGTYALVFRKAPGSAGRATS